MHWQTLLNNNRPRKSTNLGDHRAEFERDFDRSLFSTPVKRLQDKAQVFPLDPSDAVRTRLTHSLEVSSVARGLGTKLARTLGNKGEIAMHEGIDRSIEAIMATAGLIHDLGNPPFGHAGEDAIRHWFSKRIGEPKLRQILSNSDQCVSDFLKFEGNAQSLRLVAKLQILVDENGLNLTYGTLSALCKYSAKSNESDPDSPNVACRKPGHFASENLLVQQIREITGTGSARNPLALLVEAADDIVYSVADIEDGIKKEIIGWRETKERLCGIHGDPFREILNITDRILKSGGNSIPANLPDDIYASAFRTATIGVLVPSIVDAFDIKYDAIMSGEFTGDLISICSDQVIVKTLKDISREQIFCNPSILKLELMGRKVIGDLLDIFWEGAQAISLNIPPSPKTFPGKIGLLLSENYRRVFENAVKNSELPEDYHRLQLVTDYICGMTDSYAKRLHSELTNGS